MTGVAWTIGTLRETKNLDRRQRSLFAVRESQALEVERYKSIPQECRTFGDD